MGNLKIHTNNEAESKEVQELLFELGYRFYSNNGTYVRFFEHTKQLYFFANNDTWITYTTDYHLFSSRDDHTEVTLPKLRDIAVLHRNDVNDATHKAPNTPLNYYVASDKRVYFFDSKWRFSKQFLISLTPLIKETNESLHEIKIKENLLIGADAKLAWANGEKLQIDTGTGFEDLTDNYYLAVFDRSSNKFRLKPNTVTLNGIEIPAPFEPKDGEIVWVLSNSHINYSHTYHSKNYLYPFGAWRTEEEIKQVVAALCSVLNPKKEQSQ